MGITGFVRYMKSATRRCRLEAYENDLLSRQRKLLSELELALTPFERATYLSFLVCIRSKLTKVSDKLAHSPVIRNSRNV